MVKKATIIFFVFLNSVFLHGQELLVLKGDIRISIVPHSLLRNKEGELTKKISNKRNKPIELYFLNCEGILQFSEKFGKQHNASLDVVDYINKYEYDSMQNLKRVITWESDYENNILYKYYKLFLRDSLHKVLAENTYTVDNDSIYISNIYRYNANGQYQGLCFSPSYYYERDYDELGRIKAIRQVYDSKTRWEWKYRYKDSLRIGEFATYYNDGKDYTQQELRKVSNSKIMEIEEYYDGQDGWNIKTKYYYNAAGLICRMEGYSSYTKEREYNLERYTEVKFRMTKCNLSQVSIAKMNKLILDLAD